MSSRTLVSRSTKSLLASAVLAATSALAVPDLRDWPKSIQMDKTATLAGVDRDGNGVRDDIDEWLKLTYSKAPAEMRAGRQLARAVRAIYVANNPQSLTAADAASVQASNCLKFIIPPTARPKDFEFLFNNLEAFHANTDARSNHFFGVLSQSPRPQSLQPLKTGQAACE